MVHSNTGCYMNTALLPSCNEPPEATVAKGGLHPFLASEAWDARIPYGRYPRPGLTYQQGLALQRPLFFFGIFELHKRSPASGAGVQNLGKGGVYSVSTCGCTDRNAARGR